MPDSIFTPFTLRSLTIPNRIAMSPMTRAFCPDQVPTKDMAAYYRRRAENHVGLIITEGTAIERDVSYNDPGVPRFWGKDALDGWRRVVDEVHEAGGKIAPQLWHVGATPNFHNGWLPEGHVDSPSGLRLPGIPLGEPMSKQDIADTVAAFGRAAGSARELGFDAVELHGAHGYLIDQFFWADVNKRTDEYGGDIESRSRFAHDVIAAMRAAVGPDFPIIARISQWKTQDYAVKIARNPDEMEAWLRPMVEAGVDCFDCSQRRFWEPEFEGSDLNFAGWVKKMSGKPVITVGSVGLSGDIMGALVEGEISAPHSLEELLRRFERGDFDIIAVGRALLGDPEWVSKIKSGRLDELNSFDPKAIESLY